MLSWLSDMTSAPKPEPDKMHDTQSKQDELGDSNHATDYNTDNVSYSSYKWTFKNDNIKKCFLNCKNQESLASPIFSCENYKNIKWYLTCFPNGNIADCKGFTSIYLDLYSLPNDHNVKIIAMDSMKFEIPQLNWECNLGELKWSLDIENEKIGSSWGKTRKSLSLSQFVGLNEFDIIVHFEIIKLETYQINPNLNVNKDEFVWKFENSNMMEQFLNCKYKQHIMSPIFKSLWNDKIEWKLYCRPNGCNKTTNIFTAIGLQLYKVPNNIEIITIDFHLEIPQLYWRWSYYNTQFSIDIDNDTIGQDWGNDDNELSFSRFNEFDLLNIENGFNIIVNLDLKQIKYKQSNNDNIECTKSNKLDNNTINNNSTQNMQTKIDTNNEKSDEIIDNSNNNQVDDTLQDTKQITKKLTTNNNLSQYMLPITKSIINNNNNDSINTIPKEPGQPIKTKEELTEKQQNQVSNINGINSIPIKSPQQHDCNDQVADRSHKENNDDNNNRIIVSNIVTSNIINNNRNNNDEEKLNNKKNKNENCNNYEHDIKQEEIDDEEEEIEGEKAINNELKSIRKWFLKLFEHNKSVGIEYFNLFIKHGFDGMSIIMHIDDNDLIAMGIGKYGHRKYLLSEIRKI